MSVDDGGRPSRPVRGHAERDKSPRQGRLVAGDRHEACRAFGGRSDDHAACLRLMLEQIAEVAIETPVLIWKPSLAKHQYRGVLPRRRSRIRGHRRGS